MIHVYCWGIHIFWILFQYVECTLRKKYFCDSYMVLLIIILLLNKLHIIWIFIRSFVNRAIRIWFFLFTSWFLLRIRFEFLFVVRAESRSSGFVWELVTAFTSLFSFSAFLSGSFSSAWLISRSISDSYSAVRDS